ncbi:MAG: CRTAC1 family protein, partial [Edaphobacter sp.]
GVNTQYLGWGTVFMDVDNHGWPDLLLANGHVYPEVDSGHLGAAYREPRVLYRNLGDGKFKDISKDSGPGITQPESSRGLAVGDLWNDGRLEAVVNNVSGLPMLLVNMAKNDNHWLSLRLIGTKSNRDAIGARVIVTGSIDGAPRRWVDEVRSGSSYSSNSDIRLHFGLGQRTSVQSIEVFWPSGLDEIFPGTAADQLIVLKEGAGQLKR